MTERSPDTRGCPWAAFQTTALALRTAALLAIALLALPACGGGGGSNGPKNKSVDVSLVRDAWGVPHVFAGDDRAVLYGLGWATAEDRLFQMLSTRAMVQGRTAEFFGPGTSGQSSLNIQHDIAARHEGWSRQAQRAAAALDQSTFELLEAYARGVSDYMAGAGTLNPLIAQNGLPLDPWTVEDCLGAWMRFARHFSSNGGDEVGALRQWEALLADPTLTFNQAYNQMLDGIVCDDTAAVVQQSEVPAATQQAMSAYAAQHGLDAVGQCPIPLPAPKFSQAWAVAGSRTVSGRAVLVGDPRSPVHRPNRFYEWSVEGATFSVRGIGVPGCPIVLAGSSDRLAWSPTALGLDQADLYALALDPVGHPGQYQLDGQWLDFAVDELETIRVKGAANVIVRYRETRWGPVITPLLSGTLAGEEFAVRRVPFLDPSRSTVAGFFKMARANSANAFLAASEDWSWPPLNLVFADAAGTIGYSVVGDIPVRATGLTFAGVIPQDGSQSSTDWIERLPHGLQPHVVNPSSGVLYSANHMPIGAWYPIPVRFGNGGSGHTHRSRRLGERLAALPQVADSGQIAAPRVDTVHPARRDLTELGLWLRDSQPSFALSGSAAAALAELEPWFNAGASMDSAAGIPGVVVAHQIDLTFRSQLAGAALITLHGGGENGSNRFMTSALAGIRSTPPVPLTADAAAYVDRVLAEAYTRASGIGPASTWIGWYRDNVLSFDLDAWKTLEQLPPPQGATAPLRIGPVACTDSGTLFAIPEQGFTQIVEAGAGPVALSVTPPGASERPGPHELDQLLLWETANVKPAPLTMSEVMAGGSVTTANLTYNP